MLNTQLAKTEYISGDYSIADIAIYPWVAAYQFMELTFDEHSHLKRWYETLTERPAIKRGMKVPS